MKHTQNKHLKPNRTKHSLTPKGIRTRQTLLQCGRTVFETEGYFAASIAEIGRRCNVSQGTFYQYFRNKEQIFRELIDLALADFWSRARSLQNEAESFEQSFKGALRLILEHCAQYAAIHRVLNEFELIESVSISYYDSIARFYRGFFRRASLGGHFKNLDPNLVAYSLIGMAIFLQREWNFPGPAHRKDELIDLCSDLVNLGINGSQEWTPPKILPRATVQDNAENSLLWLENGRKGKLTRRALFQAAEQVLGERGYNRASISEITQRAGVAQGTFYIHFGSKEDLMDGVVRYLSRELRHELRRNTDTAHDRRDKEVQATIAFFNFLGRHSPIYRIVAESEAVEPGSAQYYYEKLAHGYLASFKDAIKSGEIRNLPMSIVVPSLMGIYHMIGLRWLVWNSAQNPEVPTHIIIDTIELVLNGLLVRK